MSGGRGSPQSDLIHFFSSSRNILILSYPIIRPFTTFLFRDQMGETMHIHSVSTETIPKRQSCFSLSLQRPARKKGDVMSNHLLREKSPYLLQHAENPVDWYPWSHEAFEKAAREDKPVFLSIGYSTCHWCHVMAPRVL